MTDEPLPDRELEDEVPTRENKGSDEDPWETDEQPYAERPEQTGGSGLRTEPPD